MRNRYPARCLRAAGALLLPGLALAQAPTITAYSPGRNSASTSKGGLNITFSQPVTGAAGIRVFSSRYRGLVTGTTAGDGTTQLSFQPAGSQVFRSEERVSVTVPATVRGTGTGGAATTGTVFEFRTRLQAMITGEFVGTASLPETGTSLHDPTLADVNGDGRLDLLLADTQNDRVRLRLSTGVATLGPATLLSTGEQPGSIAVADMNNDGVLDLLTSTNPALNRAVTVALGTSQGGFGVPTAVPVAFPTVPGLVRVGDVNADGNLDFVVETVVPFTTPAGPAAAALVVRLGNGQGSFTAAPDVPLDLGAANLHLADFNNDGRLDCLVGSTGTGLLRLYLGNGQGGFAAATTPPLPLTGPTDAADLNADGVLDVLMADRAGNAVRLYFGTGTGSFSLANSLVVNSPLAVHAADVSGDGNFDVLATYNGGSGAAGLATWRNNINSAGTFAAPQLMPNCAGTDLVAGPVGNWPGLVVVDNGLNGAGPNIKVRMNQVVLATRPATNPLAAACYPNPAHGNVQVVLPAGAPTGGQAGIYNAVGQRVRQQHLPAVPAGAPATLDISRLPAGLYTLRLTVGGLTSSQVLAVE